MPASDAATDRDWRRLRSRIRLQGSARSARPGRFAAVWRAAAAVAVVCATFFGARLYDRLLLERATERYTVPTKSGDRSGQFQRHEPLRRAFGGRLLRRFAR